MFFLLLVLFFSSVVTLANFYGFLCKYEPDLSLKRRTYMLCEGASSGQPHTVLRSASHSHKSFAVPISHDAYGHYIVKDKQVLHRVRHAYCAGQMCIYDSRAGEFLDPVRFLTQDEARRIDIE